MKKRQKRKRKRNNKRKRERNMKGKMFVWGGRKVRKQNLKTKTVGKSFFDEES